MIGLSNISYNSFNYTEYGVIHLDKNTNTHSVVTIQSSDLTRSVFKIYSNTLNTDNIINKVINDNPTSKVFYMSFRNTATDVAVNTFVDSFNVSTSGTPVIDSTVSGLRNGNASLFLNKTGYIIINNPSAVNLKINASENFTIQFYMKTITPTSLSSSFSLGLFNNGLLARGGSLDDLLYVNNISNLITYTGPGVWMHVCIVRNLTTGKLDVYINGVFNKSVAVPAISVINSTGANLYIGVASHSFTELYKGYISDFVFVKGVSITNILVY
jgi:hypothetical protein